MKQRSQIGTHAVVYARYSSHSQGEQSIEGQLAAAKRYADAKGYVIVHEYIDRAMSGRSDNRESFQLMLSDCAKKQFQVIIVWKVDRFGRNREEITFNKYRAKKHGVRIEYVAENLPDSPESVILESVLEGMAEYYSLQLAQNIRRGFLESAKKHRVLSTPPYGYRKGADGKYEIDPEKGPIVKMIFERYANGETISELIRDLNANGYRTAKGRPFTKNSLPQILSSEKYAGVYVYKDIIRDENAIPAIVSRETFDAVQAMMKRNRRMPSNKWSYTDYVLTGKIFCGHCGSAMRGESGNGKMGVKYGYYACCQKRLHPGACTKRAVRQDKIEPFILKKIQSILNSDEILNYIADITWKYYLKQDTSQEEIKSIQAQIADAEKAISNLLRMIEAGAFSQTIVDRMNDLEAQKTALKKALADRELERGFTLTREHIYHFLTRFRNYDLQDRDCQRRLVETFVNSIFVYDDKITITYNYGNESETILLSDIISSEGEKSSFADCTAPLFRETLMPQGFPVFSSICKGFAALRAGQAASRACKEYTGKSVWIAHELHTKNRAARDSHPSPAAHFHVFFRYFREQNPVYLTPLTVATT